LSPPLTAAYWDGALRSVFRLQVFDVGRRELAAKQHEAIAQNHRPIVASHRGSAMLSDDHRPAAGAVFSKREAILLAAAATAVAATLTVLLSRVTLDDAYITFRYARHLAEGYGLGAWNHNGDHVEGYSSLLWTLLLGAAAWLGVDVRVASKVFGSAAAPRSSAMPDRYPSTMSGAPYDRMDRAVFLRRDFWETHPRVADEEVLALKPRRRHHLDDHLAAARTDDLVRAGELHKLESPQNAKGDRRPIDHGHCHGSTVDCSRAPAA
jgi:hypothetical protein